MAADMQLLRSTFSMPQLTTKYFGTVDYQETDVVQFPSGLPAFEAETQFLAMEPLAHAPMVYLQSLANSSLCFLALPILTIDPDYQLKMTPEDLHVLNLAPEHQPSVGDGVICLALIAVAEDGFISANLLAPIVIHAGDQRGVQAIRVDSSYSHQHPVTKKQDVCS
jgi:flagellar assembly factor FliW